MILTWLINSLFFLPFSIKTLLPFSWCLLKESKVSILLELNLIEKSQDNKIFLTFFKTNNTFLWTWKLLSKRGAHARPLLVYEWNHKSWLSELNIDFNACFFINNKREGFFQFKMEQKMVSFSSFNKRQLYLEQMEKKIYTLITAILDTSFFCFLPNYSNCIRANSGFGGLFMNPFFLLPFLKQEKRGLKSEHCRGRVSFVVREGKLVVIVSQHESFYETVSIFR